MKLHRVGLLLLFVFLAASANGGIIFLLHYYRWASAPVTTCEPDDTESRLALANQPQQWANLVANDRAQLHFITNGVDLIGSLYDPPDGSGSQTYAPFRSDETPYPFHYTMRWDTLRNGVTSYSSALTTTCTGDGTPAAVIVNWSPGATQPAYYRWAHAPPVDCINLGDGVLLRFASQPVAWKNLPASAEYEMVYSADGTESTSGPFPAPDGDGSTVYGPLGISSVDYPLYYAVRLGTRINGTDRYESILVGACEADGPGSSRVYNVPEPGAASLALATLGALTGLAARSRQTA
jgi:hypothetical protein